MLGPKFDMTTFLATSSQNFGDLLFATFLVIFCHILQCVHANAFVFELLVKKI